MISVLVSGEKWAELQTFEVYYDMCLKLYPVLIIFLNVVTQDLKFQKPEVVMNKDTLLYHVSYLKQE